MINWPTEHPPRTKGFSLLELSIVLLIVALLAGGLLPSLSGQRSNSERQEARQQLDSARDTLLAFAIVHGRLPCPAPAALGRSEAGAGNEDCSLTHGVLPWVNLGLPETDPWGQRITYFAAAGFTRAPGTDELAGFDLATGVAPNNSGLADIRNLALNGNNKIAIDIAAVLVSHGRNAAGAYLPSGKKLTGAAAEEAENADADLSFVADTPSPAFDDVLTWISPSLLKSRLLSAGKLP